MTDCLFCDLAESGGAHVVLDDDVAFAFLDSRPVFKGHVLVMPRAHSVTLADLPGPTGRPAVPRVQRVARRCRPRSAPRARSSP